MKINSIAMSLAIALSQEDSWGERLFEVTDPNGVVYQIVQWVVPTDEQY